MFFSKHSIRKGNQIKILERKRPLWAWAIDDRVMDLGSERSWGETDIVCAHEAQACKRHTRWSLMHIEEEFGAALCSPELSEGSCREQPVSCQLLGRLSVSCSVFLGLLSHIHSLTLGCELLQGPTSLLGPLLCRAVTYFFNDVPLSFVGIFVCTDSFWGCEDNWFKKHSG